MTERPIILEATLLPDGVGIRVVGRASSPASILSVSSVTIDAAFTLEVTAGSSRSSHRGTATLTAGEAVTLASITASTDPGASWRAVLRVEPSTDDAYEQVAESPGQHGG